jgi:AraC-like DNA-binding protein
VSATVSAALIRYVLAATSRGGAERRTLAAEAGLTGGFAGGLAGGPAGGFAGGPAGRFAGGPAGRPAGEDSMRFPIERLGRLWQVSAARLDDPQLGLRVAGQWRLGACGITDYLFDTSANLGEAFSRTLGYKPILNSAGANDVGFADGDGQGTVRYQIRNPDPVVSTGATELALALMLRRARYATGHPVTPVHVGFAAAAPSAHAGLAAEFGTRHLDFGAGSTTMTFRRADLDLPLLRADPVLAEILRSHADAELAGMQVTPQWIDMFREVLIGLLDDQAVLLTEAARRLAVSRRTLQRLLEREGTNWRTEVDAARREHAARLLAEGVSKTGTAARLGYSDARALRRAIRRWAR